MPGKMSGLSQLHHITNRLLDASKNDFGDIFSLTNELYEFLLRVTGVDSDQYENRQHLLLDSGHALGLTWAAMCIKDMVRTKRFMDGITEAANTSIARNNAGTIHVLYAGTGPFATLILPLTAIFSSRQLQLTLLEINENSFACLQKMISILGLGDYVRRLEKADAVTWMLPPGETVDIFVCETMQQGLQKEPQVSIFMNMIPQLQAETIIIPEQVELSVALIDVSKRLRAKLENNTRNDGNNGIHFLDKIFTLDRTNVLCYAAHTRQENGKFLFPGTSIHIDDNTVTNPSLYILTDIIIYKNQKMSIDESALTLPLKIKGPGPGLHGTVKFWYETGEIPGIRSKLALQ